MKLLTLEDLGLQEKIVDPLESKKIIGGNSYDLMGSVGSMLPEVIVWGFDWSDERDLGNELGDQWDDFDWDNPDQWGDVDDDQLTPEQRWAFNHPLEAIDALQNKGVAEAAVANLDGLHNGYGDAARHAYWMALNAADFGADLALELGVAHEDSSDGPQAEREMDLNNNEWGANYGQSTGDFTFDEFVDAFNDAINAGDIIIIDEDTIPEGVGG